MKIISGFCSGADIGGSKAAKEMGFEVGGWVWPHDVKQQPELVEEYGVVAVPMGDNRTEYNALFSDATLHFRHGNECVTHAHLTQKGRGYIFQRPYFEVEVKSYDQPISDEVVKKFQNWLDYENPQVLNIAGNAASQMEWIAYDFLVRALFDRSPAGENDTMSSPQLELPLDKAPGCC